MGLGTREQGAAPWDRIPEYREAGDRKTARSDVDEKTLVIGRANLQGIAAQVLADFRSVPNGSQWYSMVQNGTEWYSMVPNGCEWFPTVPSRARPYRIRVGAPGGLIGHVSSGAKCCA